MVAVVVRKKYSYDTLGIYAVGLQLLDYIVVVNTGIYEQTTRRGADIRAIAAAAAAE